ncbi:4-hydroxythreonine-4-phosphate dehydrogenase PdxA [Limnohabitans sp. T6-20]|uniref:4-hydroxythreonine-4-phosphate dehydrogenase PdxA n=1 Tax=Limnohabitans sp. T6-20 TaxID=1100725 RepID=UPI000D3620AF|nr:4-hydroxythreonine-4-phosphate dehydrogenase PdxA [Limnohabitans sp. T6-20]PUE12077.1 4-hydroxythreonine-4-phosphate dehydrogenase PdxA [Limnohabitans sp. T6-20]
MTSESALFASPIRQPIAITPGDPCGIGPEIIARAWCLAPESTQACFVAGDVGLMRRAMALVQAVPTYPICEIQTPAEALLVPPRCLPVLQVVPVAPVLPWGQVDACAGQLAGEAVLWATRAALQGEVAALVTAPLHKEALHAAGAPYNQYPGHTELLQAEAARHMGVALDAMPVRMMLANDELRTVLVSIHVSLRDALEAITVERVLQTLRITDASLAKILGRRPRMAVAGVNPHAGEGGLFGREEIEVLQPCLSVARQEGLDVHGPYAPDTVFMRARKQADGRREFDVVIAMYHDQGLIPVKYLGVEQGVNVTLGLPLVRTSPDHGTAMDLAGKGQAHASSMIEAIRMARQMVSGMH